MFGEFVVNALKSLGLRGLMNLLGGSDLMMSLRESSEMFLKRK